MLQCLVLLSAMLVLTACPGARKDPKPEANAHAPELPPVSAPQAPETVPKTRAQAAPSGQQDQGQKDAKRQPGEEAEPGQQKASEEGQRATFEPGAQEQADDKQLAHRQDLIAVWQALPRASRPDFPDALMNQWSPESRLPLMRFIVHAHQLGVDVVPRLTSVAHQVSMAQQGRVVAYLNAELKHHPGALFDLLSAATDQFSAGYGYVFYEVNLGDHTNLHRLCFLAQYHRRSSQGDVTNPVCEVDYSDLLRRAPDFADNLYKQSGVFGDMMRDVDRRPRSQRSWWLTTPHDRDMVQAWFSAQGMAGWNNLAPSALLLAPYAGVGDKSETLSALAQLSDPRGAVVQAVGYLNKAGPQPEPLRASHLLRVLKAVPQGLREAAFEHVVAMRELPLAREPVRRDDLPKIDFALGLEVFGTLPTVSEMDALLEHLQNFLFEEQSPANAPSYIQPIMQLLCGTDPKLRTAAVKAALLSFGYADRRCSGAGDWGSAPPYEMESRFNRFKSVLQCTKSGIFEQAQQFLLGLERDGYPIISCPSASEVHAARLTDLYSTLGRIAPERYADLKAATGLLVSQDPERNISHLIDLGTCRKAHPQTIAQEIARIFKVLRRHARANEITVPTGTRLANGLCRAYTAGASESLAREAIEAIESGVDLARVLESIDPPPPPKRERRRGS